jgi:hypothetical protein
MLPGTDAEHGRGRDSEAILGTGGADVGHPAVSVLDFEDAPGERAGNDEIDTAAGGDAGTVVGNFD